MVEKLKMKSKDLINENIKKIGKLFPNVITEIKDEEGNIVRAIDFELLQQELSDEIIEGNKERYQLTWPGKKEAIVAAGTPIDKTLRPVKKDSLNWETTENLYIEGDNLEVLKLLQESYLNKIKCIYIDPPYNTGNDFIYKDNFTQDKDEYLEESGQVDEEGNRLFQNTEYNGRYHSDWLTMMYSRLKLARNLLSEDGAIFISIDDNEVHNLRKICDEVFGERNFIGKFVKKSKVGGGSDTKFIVKEHEYCILYAKNISNTDEMFIEHEEEYLKRYKEEDEKGRYFWDTFARPGLKNPIIYDIEAPDGTIITNGWIRSKERFLREYKDGTIRIIKKNNTDWSVQFKQYLNSRGKKPRSMTMKFGGTIEGKNDIGGLFGNDKIYSYPKSTMFIKTLLSIIEDKNQIILDFFSGSATTAHAVMELNAEDGGNRKYIMVQLPEPTDEKSEAYKAGFENISEIGKERIRRAGKKIKEETNADIDYGFRVYKVDSSNMKDVYYRPDQLKQNILEQLESNIKEDRTGLDLLTQVMLEMGLKLSLPIETREIQGKEVHFVAANSLVACFEEDVNEMLIREIAGFRPLKAVFRDSSFSSCPEKINLEEIFKGISPDTIIRVL